MIRRLVLALVILVTTVGAGLAPADAATRESAPFCGITWGSGIKRSAPANSPESPLDDIRVGEHECFDRMVVDLDGLAAGYRIQYVDEVHQVATGDVIPLRSGSGARLEIVLKLPADDGMGNPTYDAVSPRRLPRVALGDFETFRVAKYGGSFEGRTIIALGVRARLPFQVTKLDNRIILDVAHRWNE
jgi:hypothetical protein